MKPFVFISLIFVVVLSGCSFPMDYQKRGVPKIAAGHGEGRVAVVGVDDREYLKKREVDARYLGVFRDLMAAIPYRWVTKSGNPMVDDLSINLAKGLNNAGYDAESVRNPDPGSAEAALAAAQATKPHRILMIRVHELESDTQWRTELDHDITLEVLSAKGKLLATHRVEGTLMIGATVLPSLTARMKVPEKVGEYLAEGVKPLLPEL